MTDTGFAPFTPPPPMFGDAQPAPNGPAAEAPKKRGRRPKQPAGSQVAPETPKKRPGRPKGYSPKAAALAAARPAAAHKAAAAVGARSLTELMFNCDAETARVLEDVVVSIQTLPTSTRKGMIVALGKIFP